MQNKFVHIKLHTEYSIVDGLVRIKPLMKACAEKNMQAIGITDRCNFFGLIKFYQAALSSGIKPIIGTDIFLENLADEKKPFQMTLICKDKTGYQNVTKLISKAYVEGQKNGIPIIKRDWLAEKNSGIIVLSGGIKGDFAEKNIPYWKKYFFNRFYIELQRTGRENEENYICEAIEVAEKYSLPVVATNDVRFLNREDFEAHDARVCIYDGFVLEDEKRPKDYSDQQYMRSCEEMIELFSDIPEAVENTVEIAKKCNLQLDLGKVFLPNFPTPNNISVEEYLKSQVFTGLEERKINYNKEYNDRLEYELKIINQMGFAGYFLIVADFISWAKKHEIPVGPGRGSGAGSLVAYVLQITDLDPIKHELLFERFLNPERVSMPDFDIDFCMEGRDRVIDYVAEKYGRESVSQIITFGTMAARAVIRDVGRVLGHPYGYIDKIAKLIPFELGMTLEKAIQREDRLNQLYKNEDEVKTLFDLAFKLEGLTRNAGKHAGGVVISPSKLTNFVPLYCEENGENLVTQFDKNDTETAGLIKFDFLGLRTLTIINWTLQTIKIDISDVPLDDKLTFDLLKRCETTAIFQLESRGMRDLVRRLKPDHFDDIVALVALFRPGPLQSGMVDDFIERKHGRAQIKYPHPLLENILKPTYGVILYQEQVMQIAQVLAGYSLGSADLLRRAMGKKKPEEMAKHRAIFLEGAIKKNIDKYLANNIFDLIEKFAGYGFNKSHSAGYALISYQTAWLKAHFPSEFMAAVLSSDMDNTDKVVMFIEECRIMKLKIISPNINISSYKFIVNSEKEIVYGLGAIKGVGEAAIENIVFEKKKSGKFKNLFEFCRRLDTRKVNKRVLEALTKSGAFDCFGKERSIMLESIPNALKAAEQQRKKAGQGDLFGDLVTNSDDYDIYTKAKVWSDEDRLNYENEVLGLYFSGHPIEQYEKELNKFITCNIADLSENNLKVKIAGYISNVKNLITKNGKRMAVIAIEDKTAHVDVTVFSDAYQKYRDLLNKRQLVIIDGEVSLDDFTGNYRLQADCILNLEDARKKYVKCILLKISNGAEENQFSNNLMPILKKYNGGECPIYIFYQNKNAESKIKLGDDWKIFPSEKLISELNNLFGEKNVVVNY